MITRHLTLSKALATAYKILQYDKLARAIILYDLVHHSYTCLNGQDYPLTAQAVDAGDLEIVTAFDRTAWRLTERYFTANKQPELFDDEKTQQG